MTDTQIMDLTTACDSFPPIPPDEIVRENMLDTIDKILSGDTELVVVEGDEGVGKTTLLAQFARRHPDHAFSLFMRPISRWAYDPDILKIDLCNQLEWALRRKELDDPSRANDAHLRSCLYALRRRAKSTGNTYYFLLDGLDGIPQEDLSIRSQILDMLPAGMSSSLRFLIACDLNVLPKTWLEKIRFKSLTLPGFTLDETVRYLEDLPIERSTVEDIYRTTKIPGTWPASGGFSRLGLILASWRQAFWSTCHICSKLNGQESRKLARAREKCWQFWRTTVNHIL